MISGTAFSILLFAIAITIGLLLAKLNIKGITIGSTWILFIGILMGHFGLIPDPKVLSFMKDFGLILFVYSIGLQVGPGFFSSFKNGGVKLNMLAVGLVLCSALTAFVIHLISGESLQTMVGVMSGAVTNTPGLGAAQQTLLDSGGSPAETSALASAYAVAYPFGVLGVLALLIIFKAVFRVDLDKETHAIEEQTSSAEGAPRRMHCAVTNPAVIDKPLKEVLGEEIRNEMVVSRIMRDGEEFVPNQDTVLKADDKVLIVTTQKHVDSIRIIFGAEIPMHHVDWLNGKKTVPSLKRLGITKSSLTGKKLGEILLHCHYSVTVTRVVRSGVELVASPELRVQVGDYLQVVGTKEGIDDIAKMVGNKASALDKPNLLPIFLGITVGVIFGSIPISLPGIPQPIKLGLAGGPLIIAILLSSFGPRAHITTYTTMSANMMIREIGISFFLAAVGLGAGETFVSSLLNGGWWWILYGAIITVVPILIIALLGRYVFKLNFFQICGLVSGGTTNPPVLAFAQNSYGSKYVSLNYATVYPLSMFMRVLVAQLMILLAI
ncbi:MAG: putative transporter [Bacteroidales bacterium]|uniref:putative transporter n=1 Tax=Candidatus Cryptobacteroides sp. TaxID=2952915 RepID=UPI002A6C1DE7|nr:putative transporter [Candidatus Cryptobacteroides sp.]MBS7277458.1 putative transporter [Bacteroidales bacterium]MCI6527145.1 putative transporter [Bacteroidales bacterium]MDD5914627.1 putative transporter [Bacteroidales bacterium]MDD6829169.1 putative transporter [Bacteroidales bacterium]MDD7624287.1 putative transporter [Bacteroidales bacterium]